jgi:DNA repair exonuclease SbcCD ATPase subunit
MPNLSEVTALQSRIGGLWLTVDNSTRTPDERAAWELGLEECEEAAAALPSEWQGRKDEFTGELKGIRTRFDELTKEREARVKAAEDAKAEHAKADAEAEQREKTGPPLEAEAKSVGKQSKRPPVVQVEPTLATEV